MRILITAGPTREYLDDVRFLSNPSSGRMGFAIASSAQDAGHDVVLILGPVAAEPPEVAKLIRVTSAAEMLDAVAKEFPICDCFISTAAVCDYRPKERAPGKIKKASQPMTLSLVPTTDILAEMGQLKQEQTLVGFALESEDLEAAARRKLAVKGLDVIVANTPDAFAADTVSVTILDAGGGVEKLNDVSKHHVARRLMERIEELDAKRT